MADLWIEAVADQWIEVRTDSWIEVTRLFREHITLKRSSSLRVASFLKGIEKACSYKLTADSEIWVSKIMSSLNSNEQEVYDVLKLIPGQLALRDPIKFCKTIKTDRTSKNYFEFK